MFRTFAVYNFNTLLPGTERRNSIMPNQPLFTRPTRFTFDGLAALILDWFAVLVFFVCRKKLRHSNTRLATRCSRLNSGSTRQTIRKLRIITSNECGVSRNSPHLCGKLRQNRRTFQQYTVQIQDMRRARGKCFIGLILSHIRPPFGYHRFSICLILPILKHVRNINKTGDCCLACGLGCSGRMLLLRPYFLPNTRDSIKNMWYYRGNYVMLYAW